MAIEKKKFGSIEVSVCDCKDFDDVRKLYGRKLVGQLYKADGDRVTGLIFIFPNTAKLESINNEVLEWIKSLPGPSGVCPQITCRV